MEKIDFHGIATWILIILAVILVIIMLVRSI